jgi:pyruvate dehydrogenase E2 component (dihydrolipoamide acetyltransferase)
MATFIVMPKLGMVMAEGTLAKWTKQTGSEVKQGEVIAEIETEKLNYDLEATDDGVLHTIVPEGAIVSVDGVLGYLLGENEDPPTSDSTQVTATSNITPTHQDDVLSSMSTAPTSDNVNTVPSTPGARKLATKLGVDISKVTPTGPRGRVTEADVNSHKENSPNIDRTSTPTGLPTPSKIESLTGMRKSIAEHMHNSISSTAQLSYSLEIDSTEIQKLRQETSKTHNQVITSAHVLIKACAETLKRHPEHNTVLVDGNILYFDEINIGVAVALEDGLIVPVLRNVGQKDVFRISEETHALTIKAREGKLMPDDVLGGTFTISILGTIDVFTPILNQQQNAILGVGRSTEKPVIRDGKIAIREMMTVSLTADHQVIDGAVSAKFLRRFQQLIEHPSSLFKKESTDS